MSKLHYDGRRMPIISAREYDDWAEAFLKRYFPEALSVPKMVPILEIMEKKMDLIVSFQDRISSSNDILGFIAFDETEFPLYDEEIGENIVVSIPERTVLIDTSSGNIGRIRNNLAHEAVHYAFHRQFYITNLKKKGIEGIQSGKHRPISETSDIDFLEIQAHAIAPRILMPKRTFSIKANEIIDEDNDISDRDLCYRLAQLFGTSFQSASIRLKELGFDIEQMDYSESHSNVLNNESTQFQPVTTDFIELPDALNLFLKDKEFNALISSGHFRYQDGRFYSIDGQETIRFVLSENTPSGNCLFSRQNSNSKFLYSPKENSDYERLKKYLEAYLERDASEKETFAIVCREKLKKKHMTIPSVFAKRTAIDNRNIVQQIMSNDDYIPSFSNVIAILIGLDLSRVEQDRLLHLAGYQLNDSELHRIYDFCLSLRVDIDSANGLLEDFGHPILGERKKNK